MKNAGISLIIAGMSLLMLRNINAKKENQDFKDTNINWMVYAGGLAVLAGVPIVLSTRKEDEENNLAD
jgi:uncharacterized membrane protein